MTPFNCNKTHFFDRGRKAMLLCAMKSYSEAYQFLKKEFKETDAVIREAGIKVRWVEFVSDFKAYSKKLEALHQADVLRINEENSPENIYFRYPVFLPETPKKFHHAVILLHGLNERSWIKYLPWAQKLTEGLQCPVILFPISYHINRSPLAWSNPRLMSVLMAKSGNLHSPPDSSTFANMALSTRLTEHPERFYTSGKQSADDIQQLLLQIKSGTHPLLEKEAQVDFFAYSIGAFLAQIMMLTYGDTLLKNARLFMLCGGASFNRMNGVSKYIMNEAAFAKLREYYLNRFPGEFNANRKITTESGSALRSFQSMIGPGIYSGWRKNLLDKMSERIQAVAYQKDKVIPLQGIAELLKPNQFNVFDLPDAFTHENPFPLFGNDDATNRVFERIFNQALGFLR